MSLSPDPIIHCTETLGENLARCRLVAPLNLLPIYTDFLQFVRSCGWRELSAQFARSHVETSDTCYLAIIPAGDLASMCNGDFPTVLINAQLWGCFAESSLSQSFECSQIFSLVNAKIIRDLTKAGFWMRLLHMPRKISQSQLDLNTWKSIPLRTFHLGLTTGYVDGFVDIHAGWK